MAHTAPQHLSIGDGPLDLDAMQRVIDGISVRLSESARGRVARSAELVRDMSRAECPVYGVNTGFGKLVDVRIPPEDVRELQRNLVLSHAAGVGPPFAAEVVRLMLVLKMTALAHGLSGCSVELLKSLAAMYNLGMLPVVPSGGSVGASGDLAPLAHMTLPLIGEGRVIWRGEECPAGQALRDAGLTPLELGPKEGLAMLNGTQTMTAVAALALLRIRNLLKVAEIAGGMSVEALLGTAEAYDERIQQARPHPGQQRTAANLRRLVEESGIMTSHRDCAKVQDAYCLRCMPQVHGPCRDAFDYVRSVIEREANSVTDNPLVFADEERIMSGGNFHGHPIAVTCDFMSVVIASLANISERRIDHFMDAGRSDLPAFLAPEGGLNSGFMIAQVAAASLVSENKVLCHPASVDSIPTSANKEDYVSMGTWAARKLLQVVENAEQVLAIELISAAQGLDLRKPLLPGRGSSVALQTIRKRVPFCERDRNMHDDIQESLQLLRSGTLVAAVEREVGTL